MKTAVFERDFRLVFSTANEYQLLHLPGGRIELPAEFYWNALKAGISAALHAGISPSQIETVTITTQGETLVPVDKDGCPLSNAIVWLDGRAAEEANELGAVLDMKEYYRRTGLTELGGAVPVCKLMWIRKNLPEIYKKTEKFLLLEDYLLFRLTGAFVTEYSLLSSTGYFDINRCCYWREMLDLAGIDIEKLPRPCQCAKIIDRISRRAVEETGLSAETNVTTGAMDQVTGAIGAGNFKPGVVTETTGTCLVLAATTSAPNFDEAEGRFSIYRHFDENYLYVPYNPTAAIILKWFKDQFMSDLSAECRITGDSVYQKMDQLAELSAPGSNGLLLLPHFSGKIVPDFDPFAKGVFYGIGLENTRGDFIRAILESIAYMLRENIECLEKTGVQISEICSLGGGSRSRIWMQIKADVCGKAMIQSSISEFGSLGAAMLGALAAGHYVSVGDIPAFWNNHTQVFLPDEKSRKEYEPVYRKYLMLYQALHNAETMWKGEFE